MSEQFEDYEFINPNPLEESNFLAHYGKGHLDGGHSGRYPWGSGDDGYQRTDSDPKYESAADFKNDVDRMKKAGLKENEITKALGFETSSELRAAYRAAGVYARNDERVTAVKLKDEGLSLRAIAKKMGYTSDSSVRTLLDEDIDQRKNRVFDIAKVLKDKVDELGMVDVGAGSEVDLGITEESLNQAIYLLQAEYGYKIMGRRQQQVTNKGNYTRYRVAVPPDAPADYLYKMDINNRIRTVKDYGNNPNKNITMNVKPTFAKPVSIARNRIHVIYAEEGGLEREGMWKIRPGVKDLSLSGSHYSQIRIAVDNEKGEPSYYCKGMAVYGKPDEFPEGCDIICYSNKKRGAADKDVFKKLKTLPKSKDIDWENPFGSKIKDLEQGGQYYYIDDDGKEKLGAINKRADEGDWLEWAKKLPAQFLSKQPIRLIKTQLDKTIEDNKAEFDEIKTVNNPVVKQKLLEDFAGGLDSQAVHLRAASLPRQKYEVIMPVVSMKDNECYAPNFSNGEKLALIRFPHAGPFELPILTVNNRNQEAIDTYSTHAKDVVGINKNVAGRLSGADFDGDTVLAIPVNDKVQIASAEPLQALSGFDDKAAYPPKYQIDEKGNKIYDENGDPIIISKVMSKASLQNQMGQITNLISDMTLSGCSEDELARAVKHSMVVVDAAKHKLDYKASEIENGIRELKEKYQKHSYVDLMGKEHIDSIGSGTIITRSKAQVSVREREGYKKIDPETGKYVYTRDSYKQVIDYKNSPTKTIQEVNPDTGEVTEREVVDYDNAVWKDKTRKSNWMSETDDAMTLVRDPSNPVEVAYAQFANELKALANEARKERMTTKNMVYSPDAAKEYADEVASLNNKLIMTKSNKPREREAQTIANIWLDERINQLAEVGEVMDNSEEKKLRDKLLKKARAMVGAARYEVKITDREWEAIQAGAISHNRAKELFEKADPADIKERATPRTKFEWTDAKANRAMNMYNKGYTFDEIAKAIGTSTTTINKLIEKRK